MLRGLILSSPAVRDPLEPLQFGVIRAIPLYAHKRLGLPVRTYVHTKFATKVRQCPFVRVPAAAPSIQNSKSGEKLILPPKTANFTPLALLLPVNLFQRRNPYVKGMKENKYCVLDLVRTKMKKEQTTTGGINANMPLTLDSFLS